MWIFTKYGFYSVTVADAKNDVLKVRARAREDLEKLLKFIGPDGKGKLDVEELPEIIEDARADYRWRVFMPRLAWAEIMLALTDDLDYGNFKNQITDSFRHGLYASIWSIMLKLQNRSTVNTKQQTLWDMWDNDAGLPPEDEIDGQSELMSLLDQEERLEDTGFQVVDGEDLDGPLFDDDSEERHDPTSPFYDPEGGTFARRA